MGDIERTKPSWMGMLKILVQAAIKCIGSDFYIVDLIERTITKLPGILWNHGLNGTTVVLDSVLYAIRNIKDKYSKDLIPKAIDINAEVEHIHSLTSVLKLTEKKWKPFRKMNYNRWRPNIATHGSKIYAFGGSDSGTSIGEVYDTVIGEWEIINPPSTTDDGRDWDLVSWNMGFPLSDPKNNRLLVHFSSVESLYAYYPDNDNDNKWEFLDRNIREFSYPSMLVDDVIYFPRPMGSSVSIMAYDVLSKKSLKVSLSSSFRNLHPSMYFASMEDIFYLGNGMLCLAGFHPILKNMRLQKMLAQFVRFSVERINPELVQVTPISVHSFPIKGFCEPSCFVPLQG